VVSSCSKGRGAESIAIFRLSHAVLALLSSGCQLAFPLDGYDDGAGSDAVRCESAFLCEDFETGVSPARWQNVITAGSTVEIDEVRFHRGHRALHAHVATDQPDVEAKAQLNHAETLPERAFVRFYAWVQPSSVDDVVVGVAMQGQDPFEGMNLRVTPLGLVTLTNWAEEPDANYDGTTSLPPDRWSCLEWSLDRTSGAVTLTQDGEPSVSATASTLVLANWFQIGALLTQPQAGEASDVWLDDLIIDEEPIGCE
jgi:hypothetical protein